jgi:glutathione reductase (NADPH)
MNVDLVVVGSGEAAQGVLHRMRAAGWSVAAVDSRPFGGTCSLRGCDPKKVLVGVAELVDWGRRMQGSGISAPVPALAWSDMIAFKRSIIESVSADVENGCREAGITALHGRAHFVGPTTLAFGDETITAGHVLIAGGARHAPLGIPGEEHLTKSTDFLELDRLPPRVAFVGGGYVAFEFAHIAARAGAEVRVLHRGERPLETFDPDLVGQLVQITHELGVAARLGTDSPPSRKATATSWSMPALVNKTSSSKQTSSSTRPGRSPRSTIWAWTRRASSGPRTGASPSTSTSKASATRRCTRPATPSPTAGSGSPPSPPSSRRRGHQPPARQHPHPGLSRRPTVVFTTPPLARVGLTEPAASAQGPKFTTHHEDTTGWYSSRRLKLAHTGFKTLTEEGTGRLLGAHQLGPHA